MPREPDWDMISHYSEPEFLRSAFRNAALVFVPEYCDRMHPE